MKTFVVFLLMTLSIQAQDSLSLKVAILEADVRDINLRLNHYKNSRNMAAVMFIGAAGLGLIGVVKEDNSFLIGSVSLAGCSQFILHFSAGTLKRKRK